MRNFRKLGSAMVLAGFVAAATMTFDATLHAAGPGAQVVPGFCKILPAAIQKVTDLGLKDLAAYLQSIFDRYCS